MQHPPNPRAFWLRYIAGRQENDANAAADEHQKHVGRIWRPARGLDLSKRQRLVAGVYLVVRPSVDERFGLLPLETIAAGTSLLVARSDALNEVCGDAAACCDPRDPRDIAAQLVRLLGLQAARDDLRPCSPRRAGGSPWTTRFR